MDLPEAETCPECGSGKLVLLGLVRDGQQVRELVCLACTHSWAIELGTTKVVGHREP